MNKYKKGEIVEGIVTGVEPYGIFVMIDETFQGMIHISEVSEKFVINIYDYVEIGQSIYVEILDIYENKKQMNLSIKNINYKFNNTKRRARILETGSGFGILKDHLDDWIEENLKNIKKN